MSCRSSLLLALFVLGVDPARAQAKTCDPTSGYISQASNGCSTDTALLHDGAYGSIVAHVTYCQARCEANDQCNFFTFFVNTGWCEIAAACSDRTEYSGHQVNIVACSTVTSPSPPPPIFPCTESDSCAGCVEVACTYENVISHSCRYFNLEGLYSTCTAPTTPAPTPAPTTPAPTPAPTPASAGTPAPTPAPTPASAGTPAPTPAPTPASAVSGADLELMFPDGARADLRAQDGATYGFLSAQRLAVNGRMDHIEFDRFHPELSTFYSVNGSFMTALYVTASLVYGGTVHIEYDPGESFKAGCKVTEIEKSGFTATTVLTPDALKSWSNPEANISASFDVGKPKLRVTTSEWNLVVRAMSIRGAVKKRLDLVMTPLERDPSKNAVAPHGLLGQAWDGDDIAVQGKTDTDLFAEAMTRMSLLGQVEKVKTVANAEGAIEGVESDYIVSHPGGDPFSTNFKFSRFGLSFAAPRNVSQLTGMKKRAAGHTAGVNGFIASVEA